jgi:hypothetical protein
MIIHAAASRTRLRACLTNARLLRPTLIGIFLRSFPLHSLRYAPETIAESCSIRVALATAIISQTGSKLEALPASLLCTAAARPGRGHGPCAAAAAAL